jgi:hypothetical protein
MKQLFLIMLLLCCYDIGYAQSVGIGTTTPDNSAALDINSANKGLLMPRMSSVQRKAIASPAPGLFVFDTDKNCFFMFDGAKWQAILFTNLLNLPGSERVPDSTKIFDYFGYSVDISGNYAVVGAPADQVDGFAEKGSAYVFEKINGNWTEVVQLKASDGLSADHFGYSVTVSGDYIAVSSLDDDSGVLPAITDHGSVYIFHRTNGTWIQEFKIRAADYATGERFGTSISMSGDNLIIGAPNDDNGSATSCGSIYFYQRSGATWNQLNKFFRTITAANDQFGRSVSINGSYAIAGAPFADVNGNTSAGSIAIYVYGGGTWTWQTTINCPNNSNVNFGYSVTISDNYAIIGGPALGLTSSGVYSYQRSGSTWTFAGSMGYLTGGGFGLSVSLSGNYLLIGASLDNNNSAYLYKKREQNLSWEFVRDVKFDRPTVYGSQESFYPDKEIIALDGDNCVFGHPHLGPNAYRSGSVLFLNISD